MWKMGLLGHRVSLLVHLQCRGSRHSVEQYRRRKAVLHAYRVDKAADVNPYELMERATVDQVVPQKRPGKTSLTIDILDEETYPKLSQWRINRLVGRARRVLPLPISLTTDDKLGKIWKQHYIYSLRKRFRDYTASLQHQIPEFVRLMAKEHPEILRERFPMLYDNYQALAGVPGATAPVDETTPYMPFSQQWRQPATRLADAERLPEGYSDQEYENYLKHNELLKFLADKMQSVTGAKYEPEIRQWASEVWLRHYGRAEPAVPASRVPCSGCGAHLHCTATNIPGFMPAEKFTLLTPDELGSQLCQRCEFLTKHNVSLNVTVPEGDYPRLISSIRASRALVIILVDLLDFPCSVWPGIINLIGETNLVYIVGNKLDLLPQDGQEGYLDRVRRCLKETLRGSHIEPQAKIRDVSLISAKTGYGVDNLVTKLLRDLKPGQHIYLLGCTNAGKSTLFNVLLQSDLCAVDESRDLVHRATTSVWPGTTLGLLKFPVRRLRAWELQMRLRRLNLLEKRDIEQKTLALNMTRQSKLRFAQLQERLDGTISTRSPFLMDGGHPLLRTVTDRKPFQQQQDGNDQFLYDTPGVLYRDQLLNLLTTEELLRTLPREIITPRTYTLRPHQSLFLGGLARLDLCQARQHVHLTVFASLYLPVNIVYMDQANHFYQSHLGTEFLAVPLGDNRRLRDWPELQPRELELCTTGWQASAADLVLSSAGWVAVTGDADSRCVIRAYTPAARGIHLRTPAMLPYAVQWRGRRIPGTPCFENRLYSAEQLLDQRDRERIERRRLRTDQQLVSDQRLRDALSIVNGRVEFDK